MNRYKVAMRIGALALTVAALALLARAQDGLPLPSAVEKELAARASDVTEVTLDKNMLGFASKFMSDNGDDAHVKKLIAGLQGVYVRDYEFDKEGQYSMDDVARLRAQFETPEWSPIVRERERNSKETTEVLVKMVNGEPQGIFVLDAEPKELAIVLILGPVRMEDLGDLRGLTGLAGPLGPLSGAQHTPKADDKPKTAQKPADKKGDDQ
jgi:hypothetical protein